MSKVETKIVIPSRGRPHEHSTISQIPKRWLRHTIVAVPAREERAYQDSYRQYGVTILTVPEGKKEKIKYIGQKRQWLMENVGFRYLYMIDDDIEFHYRPNMHKTNMRRVDQEKFGIMVDLIFRWIRLEGIVQAGVCRRLYSNNVPEPFLDNRFHYANHAVDTKFCLKNDIRWDKYPIVEEIDFFLQLAKIKAPQRTSFMFATQTEPWTDGGCSEYRTRDMETEIYNKIAAEYPGWVTFRKPRMKKGTATWDLKPLIVVHSKKAYRE